MLKFFISLETSANTDKHGFKQIYPQTYLSCIICPTNVASLNSVSLPVERGTNFMNLQYYMVYTMGHGSDKYTNAWERFGMITIYYKVELLG